MAKTSNVFARVEPGVKEQAEQVLNELGIPMSNAVNTIYRSTFPKTGKLLHHIKCLFHNFWGFPIV